MILMTNVLYWIVAIGLVLGSGATTWKGLSLAMPPTVALFLTIAIQVGMVFAAHLLSNLIRGEGDDYEDAAE
jgi:hypothetical protein